MGPARREEIARIADGGRAVFVDDMTLSLITEPSNGQPPLAALTRSATVVTIDSFSKTFLAGLRVGWLRAPAPLMEGLARLKVVSDLGSSHVSQILALRLFPFLEQISELRRRQLRERLDTLTDELSRHLPSWSWTRPAGGACLWVELPVGDAEAFAQVAFRSGVRVIPGVRMSPNDGLTRYLRISFVTEPSDLVEAVRRLKTAWSVFERSSDHQRAPVEVAV
jgi:DNA-binding transcriptional MocR family regulator